MVGEVDAKGKSGGSGPPEDEDMKSFEHEDGPGRRAGGLGRSGSLARGS